MVLFSLNQTSCGVGRLCALLLSIVFTPAMASGDSDGPKNNLADHPSPYLALHGNDPVHWFDFGEVAMETARREGKLVFVSSGYFSCHWCHVMQRESYQNEAVADFLNQHFVSVKLDRELNPAIDKRLMDFAQATQGRGGWPLNVYLTPDGFPLYAHMYQPSHVFKDVLEKLQGVWIEQEERLRNMAAESAVVPIAPPDEVINPVVAESTVRGLLEVLADVSDPLLGGFGEQARFPMVPQLDFYLDTLDHEASGEASDFLRVTLDAMADGGLRDHIGGGFFRYTTDADWETPHFEKMLYTNALLVSLYIKAAERLDQPAYLVVARDTLDFMLREMADDSGAMVASFSAIDDDDVEGGHYLWNSEALADVLDKATRDVVLALFSLDGASRFPAGNLPMRTVSVADVMKNTGKSEAEIKRIAHAAKSTLYAARQSRSRPADTKLLAGWNGLALRAFAEGARHFTEPRYQAGAKAIRDYIVNTLWVDGALLRAVSSEGGLGQSSVQDYAYVAQGLLAYARMTGESADFRLAETITREGFERFNRDNGWFLAERSLIMPEQVQPALEDGALPSPSAVLAEVAWQLSERQGGGDGAADLYHLAQRTLSPAGAYLHNNLFGFASYARVMHKLRAANVAASDSTNMR